MSKYTFEIYLDTSNSDLYNMYHQKYIEPEHISSDSGLDLYFPDTITVPANSTMMIDLKVTIILTTPGLFTMRHDYRFMNTHGYLVLPRSSIYKTSLRMANSVGLIDCEYRNTLKVVVDNIKNEDFIIEKGTRLFQCTTPTLDSFKVDLLDNNKLNINTNRGLGGFGSTGV